MLTQAIHYPVRSTRVAMLCFCLHFLSDGQFLAASLTEGHVTNDNLRLAFDKLDYDNSGKVTSRVRKRFEAAKISLSGFALKNGASQNKISS